MKEIDIFQYNDEDTKDNVYDVPVKLLIKKESYEAVKEELVVSRTSSFISFHNVAFNSEISINVDDGIHEELHISFHNCYIDTFSSFALESENISISFGACLVEHFSAQHVPLSSLTLNNCFGTFFIIDIKSCNISYSENNINLRDWIKLKGLTGYDSFDKILAYKTNYYITDVPKFHFKGNEISQEIKNNFKYEYKRFYADPSGLLTRLKAKTYLTNDEKLKLNINLRLTNTINHDHISSKVSSLLLRSIELGGKPKGEIEIEDSKIDDVYIRNFSPKGDFSLYNIETRGVSKGKFEIHNSNLDNTWFNSVKLNQYFIVFFKSSFVNTKFYSTIFPSTKELLDSSLSSVENIHYPDKKSDKEAYNRDMYELFLELKQAFEKRGNVFEAQKMKAVSQDFLLKIESNNIFKSDFWNNKFVLYLNRASNFHGLSIRNAFLCLIVIILLFQWLNVVSFKTYSFTFNSWEEVGSIIEKTFKYIFVIANPAHKVSSLAPEGEITSYTYAVSFFSRIAVGYLYYQFIAAFRRFGK